FEHFDYLLYQQKAHRLMQVSTSNNHDFDILSDPDSEEHKLLMTLPPHLATSISVKKKPVSEKRQVSEEARSERVNIGGSSSTVEEE
ncbi:MAG TPA: hypothetical protein VFS97_08260, partial [Nitrososphaeraceae archaeon]|nr:hypothetical protein [Nitrososphaeraceae archaeon]